MNVYYVHEDLQNMETCIKFEYEKKKLRVCMFINTVKIWKIATYLFAKLNCLFILHEKYIKEIYS